MKSFYKKFLILMLPMALKDLISALVNLLDTVMVGRLGETAIAAVGIGNQVYFLFTVFLFGMNSGAGVFASQYWGQRDIHGVRRTLGLNLVFTTSLSLCFILAATCFPAQIFRLYNASPEVIAAGVPYLRIVCIGYLATAISMPFDISVCCTERAGLPFLVRAVGLVVNALLNWVLIFGHLGAPALGVIGAAIATVIARFTELGIMLGGVYGRRMVQAAKPRELFSISRDLVGRFFRTGAPVIFGEMCWALGNALYAWIFAQVSPESIVVVTIAQNIERLMLVFFQGAGNAAGVFVGKAVGANRSTQAYVYAKRLTTLTLEGMLLLTGIFILARPLMLLPYNISPEVHRQCMNMLLVISLMSTIKALNFLLIVGVLRNGGDTRTAFLIDCSCVWFLGVPLTVLGGLVFHLPLIAVYILSCGEELGKIFFSVGRFRSKRWIKNVVSEV